ncbi:CRISPR-associated endonuclease Cas1 [Streptomyces badius]
MTTPSQRTALTPRDLTRTGERLSFVYLERCTVHRDANALTATDADGTTHIPSATIGTLLLGPGTRITHQAMSVLGDRCLIPSRGWPISGASWAEDGKKATCEKGTP